MSAMSASMTRHVVTVDELRVGDMREIGRNHISRIHKIEPYWTGPNRDGSGLPLHIDHRYLVIDGVYPPRDRDEEVAVWR